MHNIDLLRNLAPWRQLGFPLVVGVSRKRFIGTLSGQPAPKRRAAGSLAAALFALGAGASTSCGCMTWLLTVEAVRVWHALGG